MDDKERKALNREIAEALGWTQLRMKETWEDNAEVGYYTYETLCGTSPDGVEEQFVDNYAGDLNAVVDALPDGVTMCLDEDREFAIEGRHECQLYDDVIGGHGYSTGETKQIAAARALLNWLKSKVSGGGRRDGRV